MPATSVESGFATALDMARSACRRRQDAPLVHYFGTALTGGEVDAASDALAAALAARGVGQGDRVALYLQNVPQLPIGLIAAWKLGAIAVPVNPMLRERELADVLADSGATAIVSLEQLHEDVTRHALAGSAVRTAISSSPLDYLDAPPSMLSDIGRRPQADAEDFRALVAAHAGQRPPDVRVEPDDVATLVYTSGTTGPPKGAMNLHRNIAFASTVWRDWPGLRDDDVNLGLAPLFHITGLIAGLGVSLAAAAPLVLGYRFDPAATLELIARHRPTFTVAAITAYQALMRAPGFDAADFGSLRAAYTGGAPVAPAVAEAWRSATGVRLHNAYGLTESTSPLTLTPLGAEGRVDPASGALSVGVPVYDSRVEILGDDGAALPPGEIGEIVATGPQVVPGYWRKPDETAIALPDGRLRTGDVGYVDGDGWVYLVDRRKDLIIASGFKVWPREVEDVLYTHPAVREAAVVGVADAYRGETVKAYVSLKAGAEVTVEELVAHCKQRMAAYKYPREVEVVDELPKSPTGKILRRSLRARAATEA